MLDSSENAYRVALISRNPYTLPYPFWSDSDIQVWVTKDDSDVLLDPTTDYTIVEDQVTLSEEAFEQYEDYDLITFLRVVEPVQTTDYANGSIIDAEQIERSFDKLTAITQQLSEAQSRSIVTSVSEEGESPVLPPLVGRANTLIGFGADGKTMITRSTLAFDADVAAASQNAESSEETANLSRQYAEGKKLNNQDVQEGEAGYDNNAKYYANRAALIRPEFDLTLEKGDDDEWSVLCIDVVYNYDQPE